MSRDVGESGSGQTASTDTSPETDQYATLANAVADGLFQIDADDRLVASNDAFLDIVGRTREELLGAPLDRAFPLSDAERLSAARRGLVGSDSATVMLPASLPTEDGEEHCCEIRLCLVEGTDGGAAGSVRVTGEAAEVADEPAEAYGGTLGHDQEESHAETEKFRSLVEAVEEYAIFMLDPEGGITSWNEGVKRIKGYDAEEVVGEHISTFYTDEDRAAGVPEMNLAEAAEKGAVEDEGWRVRADGSRFWANVVITSIRDDDGTLAGYAKVTRDMTERREHEEALRQQRDLTERILEASPLGIAALTIDGEIEMLNDHAAKIVGTSKEEVQNGTYRGPDWNVYDEAGDPLPPEDRTFAQVIRTGEPVFNFETQVERPDGERRWLTVNGVPITDSSGETTHVVLTYEDRTERRENEEALRRERNLVTQILETSPVGIALVDEDNQLVRTNERAAKFAGRTPTELLELFATEIELYDEEKQVIPPENHPSRQVLESGESVVGGEYQIQRPDGEWRWLTIDASTIEDVNEAKVVLAVQDITPLKRREAQLRQERDLTDQILNANPVGIAVMDGSGDITRLNRSGAEILSVDPEDVNEYELEDWAIFDEDGTRVPPPEWPQSHTLRTGKAVFDWRCEIKGQDGSRRWVSANTVPIRDGAGAVERIILTANDITTLKRRETDLRRERDLTERILETSPIGIAVMTAQGEVEHVNERGQDILGIDTATLDPASDNHGQLLDEEGRPISNEERPSVRAFSTGERVTDWQCQYDHPDGGLRWLSVNATPVYDEDGAIERVITVGDDITQLKEQARQLERQRDDLAIELDEMFRRIDDAFYAVDDQFRFTYVNERAEALLQHDEATLLGRNVWEVFPQAAETAAWESFNEALESQEPTSYEVYFDPLDFWVEANVYPSETGLSVYFRDVTERKERERELETYETIVKTVDDGVYVCDEEFRFTMVNDAYVEMTGYDREELIGAHASLVVDEAVSAESADRLQEIATGEATSAAIEADIHRADGSRLRAESKFTNIPSDDIEHPGKVGVVRDVTERKERERELERYETIVETVNDGIYVVDEQGRFTMVNDEYASMTGYDREELVGADVSLVVDDSTVREARTTQDEMVGGRSHGATLEADIRTADGELVPAEATFALMETDDTIERIGVARDITERRERERQLEESRNRYQALVENFPNGAVALVDEALRYKTVGGTPIRESNATVAELEGSKVDEILPPDIADVIVPRYVDALDGERSTFEQEIGDRIYQFWTLPVHNDSGDVFAALGMSQDITERLERERALERQREELAALNRLNEVVQETTHAIVESSSREEIERLVCERLADSESYLFAWVGEVDRTSDTVALRTEAGVTGYLDDVTLAVDPEDGDVGPTVRAIQSREPQVVHDTTTDPIYEPWREVATEYDFRSSAAIPIIYEDILYGVLNVYSARPGAFNGYERTLLARLGNVVGHTINALERKEALMSDQIQEVDIVRTDVVSLIDGSVPTDGSITFERTVSVGEDTYLQYGTSDEEGMAMLEAIVDAVPFWESVTTLDERFGTISFELRLSEPPAISTMASYGGRIRSATIEDGDFQMRVELPPAMDVRTVVEALTAEYPGMEVVAQRRRSRDVWSVRHVDDLLDEQLTDRQRAALEAAYFAGYFDTPRKRSGEAVAESLDITAPTLHQHLRKGQRKLLSAVFDTPEKE